MVHIRSSGDYAWRADLYDRVGEQLGERTKAGAIDEYEMPDPLEDRPVTDGDESAGD